MNDNKTQNRLRTIFVGLISLMLIAQISVAPAAAATSDPVTGGECYLRGSAGFWGGFLGVDVSQCQTPSEDAAETHAEQYSTGLSAADMQSAGVTNYQNQLQGTRNLCLCQVKAGAIESLQNGENISTAKQEANATIDGHYSNIQRNVLTQHNSQINTVFFAVSVINDKGVDHAFIDTWKNNGYSGYQPDQSWGNNAGYHPEYRSANVTLADGTSEEALGIAFTDGGTFERSTGLKDLGTSVEGEGAIVITEPGYIADTNDASIDETRSVQAYEEDSWVDVWYGVESEHDYVTNNSMTYIEDLYAAHSDGEFSDTDAMELQDSCSLATLASDKDTTGSLDWARAAGVLGGYDTSANSSWVIEYTPAEGTTFSGDTAITGTASGVTLSSPSLGDGATVKGSEMYRVTTNPEDGTTISNVSLLLEDDTGEPVTTVDLRDPDGDGVYAGSLESGNYSTISSGASLLPVVEYVADDGTSSTTTQVVMAGDGSEMPAGWTYAPNGGESVFLSGSLFTDWKPASTNESFDTGATYDTANSGGESVIFLDSTQSGQAPGYYTLNGSFTVLDLYNAETGEPVNSTMMEDYNTQTFDAVNTRDEVTRILDDYFEDSYKPLWGGGNVTLGGGGGMFSGLANALGVGGVIVLGSLLLILYGTRSQ